VLLLIDENVPRSVAEVFARRGHDVRLVRDLFPAGIPDLVIATIGDRLSAIVVTLLEKWIDMIEFHYERSQNDSDLRMIVQIQESGVKFV
jgi:predicted nuclease of predicted toxin-antitoxin system